MSDRVKYALRITCKEVRAFDGTILTPSGTVVWASESSHYYSSSEERNGKIPPDIYTFDTFEEADAIGKTWKGYPWFYSPGVVEVVAVTPTFKMVQDGWASKATG
jgi:hypothetical protein